MSVILAQMMQFGGGWFKNLVAPAAMIPARGSHLGQMGLTLAKKRSVKNGFMRSLPWTQML
eukprot:1709538-Karenia_brevis.AAC.1